jgi:hypothetical protein
MTRRSLPWFLPVVALAAALVLCAAPLAAAPAYSRIQVSPTTIVYAQFEQGQLRMATTVAGLKTARAVKAKQSTPDSVVFPEVSLPVSADALPAGCSKVRAVLYLRLLTTGDPSSRSRTWYAYGVVGPSRTDQEGALWTYWFTVGAPVGAQPEQAQVMQVPDPGDLKLSVVAKGQRREIGVGVRVMAWAAQVYDIQEGGQTAQVHVLVRDADGNGIASERGPLSKFGFGSGGAPRYSARVALTGKYNCEATLDAGPVGTLKGAAAVTVE